MISQKEYDEKQLEIIIPAGRESCYGGKHSFFPMTLDNGLEYPVCQVCGAILTLQPVFCEEVPPDGEPE